MMNNDINKLIEKKERIYFFLVAFFAALIYVFLLAIIYERPLVLGHALSLFLLFFVSSGMFIGHLKQNAVKVSEAQFADIHKIVADYSKKLALDSIPSVYVLQSGGILNAFVTRFLFKDFVVIYSDVLELAYSKGEDAVKFIIAHELAHIKRNHVSKTLMFGIGTLVPFLGSAYSRACETTCDKIAAYLSPKNPANGLLALLAGKELYSRVKLDIFLKEAEAERGFWSKFAEITSSHPHLSSRLRKIKSVSCG
jgi:Zn-dependent protease with chaperone function